LTLEVSPETVRRIAGDPEALRRAAKLIDAEFGEEQDDYKLTPDDIDALKRGAADIDAGRVSDAKANSAERREMIRKRRLEKVAHEGSSLR
jgi:predicted transcriptional regulator